jgi:large subunit ribosomal protein L10
MAEKYGKKVRELMVKEFADMVSENKGFVLSSLDNVKASDIDVLRKTMRQSGSRYLVIKNRLARIAMEEAGVTEIADSMKEQKILGVGVIVEDPVLTAKQMVDFAKTMKGFTVKNGYLEGRILPPERIKELAALPGREQLIAMVVGMMNAPIAGVVRVLSSILRSPVLALNALKEKKERGE